MGAYGSWYLPSATGQSVVDGVAEPMAFFAVDTTTSGSGVTFGAATRMVPTAAGIYIYEFVISYTFSIAQSTKLTVSFAADDVIATGWNQARITKLTTDAGNMAGMAMLSLTAGAIAQLYVETTRDGVINYQHAAGTLRRIDV